MTSTTAARRTPWFNGKRSWGHLLIILSIDNTFGTGGDTYNPQNLGQSGYDGSNTVGGGGQTGAGPVGIDYQSGQQATSGQYGGPDRVTTTGSQSAGYVDPRIAGGGVGREPEYDDEYGAASGAGNAPTGKPSMTSRVKGTSSPHHPSVPWSCTSA